MNYHLQQLRTSVLCYVNSHGEHVRFTKNRWIQAVRQGKTLLGYSEWVAASVMGEFSDTQPTTEVPV